MLVDSQNVFYTHHAEGMGESSAFPVDAKTAQAISSLLAEGALIADESRRGRYMVSEFKVRDEGTYLEATGFVQATLLKLNA